MMTFEFGKKRFLLHLLFWTTYLLITSVVFGFYEAGHDRQLYIFISAFLQQLLFLPTKIIVAVFIMYYLLPEYIFKKKYIQFSLLLLLSIVVFAVLQRTIEIRIINNLLDVEVICPGLFYFSKMAVFTIESYAIAGVATAIKLMRYWFVNQRLQQELKNQKLESELKLLKGQIHPHFLFNTLNSLYGNAMKKSEVLPDMILQLSSLLNYMLYDCNVSEVPIDKEIDYINNYIALEKQRYSDRLNVMLSKQGKSAGKTIAPLLLLPLIENSFKHGVSKTRNDAWINIDIKIDDDFMRFTIENSKNQTNNGKKEEYTEGIGLKNVKKRLDLLYSGRHKLTISDEKTIFKVTLEIKINTNN